MVEIGNEILNLVGIIVSVLVPVILIRFFHVSDSKRIEKDKKLADDLRFNTERIATDLKTNEERIAKDLKLASVDIAAELQIHLDNQNNNVMHKIEAISDNMISLGERVDKISLKVDELSHKQSETQRDQLALIKDLQHRADLTNGNIQHIRNDIMDVQDVVDNVSDRMKQQSQRFFSHSSLSPQSSQEQSPSSSFIENQPQSYNTVVNEEEEQTARDIRNKQRRAKRKEIEDDAISQGIAKSDIGRYHSD